MDEKGTEDLGTWEMDERANATFYTLRVEHNAAAGREALGAVAVVEVPKKLKAECTLSDRARWWVHATRNGDTLRACALRYAADGPAAMAAAARALRFQRARLTTQQLGWGGVLTDSPAVPDDPALAALAEVCFRLGELPMADVGGAVYVALDPLIELLERVGGVRG